MRKKWNDGKFKTKWNKLDVFFNEGRRHELKNTYFYNTNTSGTRYSTMEWYSNGTVYANDYLTGGNSLRAPIFYDSNNTAYYVDPNGTARLSYVVANGGIRIDGNENLYLDNNYGQSVVGVYTSTRYQGVFAMGNAYKLSIDGAATNNHYGIAWSHPNAGGQASYLNDHGMLVQNYGTTFSAISSRIWARSSMMAPIFYDHDTGYYGDFNSTSRFNYIINNNIYCYDWIFAQGNIIAYYSDERLKTKVVEKKKLFRIIYYTFFYFLLLIGITN